MTNLANAIQSKIKGEVLSDAKVRDYYSTDGSIFTITPKHVVFPSDVKDISQVVKTLNNNAKVSKKIGLTVRGKGTDQAGGALGDGVVMVMPAHHYHLLKVTPTHVRVQPGAIYGDLQQILNQHGRYLPCYPSSIAYCTIGGAVANNACGEHTVKYGSTRDYTESLQIVLSNGEVITTRRLSARQLAQKKKLNTFEGKIYRELDHLITYNIRKINEAPPHVTKNSAGYDLWDVKRPDGSFDLTPLIVGSQGTLAVVSEIVLRTEPMPSDTSLIRVNFKDLTQAGEAAEKLRALNPSALELVDHHLLEFLQATNPGRVAEFVGNGMPAVMFLVEFDDKSAWRRKQKVIKALKILRHITKDIEVVHDPINIQRLWRIRRSAAAIIWKSKTKAKALPIIEDAAVPVGQFVPFLKNAYKLFDTHKIKFAVWGHAGDANFHIQPFFDLAKKSDQIKLFKVVEEFYSMVIAMGGTTAGEHNDGRLRAPFLPQLYGQDMYQLFKQVKD
ncbi:FAD-binding oxidoreductase, partial [Candidatus Saccharibacteria bacterium]|nr:FAD-binding oxidoreductase [Candidatus Saccharibacteria bacterium]